jgi:hypothetical protein
VAKTNAYLNYGISISDIFIVLFSEIEKQLKDNAFVSNLSKKFEGILIKKIHNLESFYEVVTCNHEMKAALEQQPFEGEN